MTEEVKTEEVVTEVVPEVKEPTEVEQRAMEMGWRPKEEFNGDEVDFIDAGEFIRRAPLFEKIEGQSKEIKAVRKALEQFKQHYGKVEVAAYNRALADLQAKKKEARREGDFDTEDLLDDQIKQVEKQAAIAEAEHKAPAVVDEPALPPEFVAWKTQNQWYDKNRYMRVFADDLGVSLRDQGVTPTEILKKVEQEVKKKFPDQFNNPRKASAPLVEENKGGSGKTDPFEESLSALERNIMNNLVKNHGMKKEKYLADLKLIKGQK